MTKEQYNEWRNHPATQFYRQFLRDYRSSLIQAGTEAWLNGSNSFETGRDLERGRIAALFDVEDLRFETIEAFYKEKEDGSETAEAALR